MKVKQVLLSAALAASPLALGQAAPAVLPDTGQQSASLKKLVPSDAEQFARRLHQTNELEVRLGALAEQKAASPQVKEFGRMMVQDHGTADQKLMTLAKAEKWNLKKNVKPSNTVERVTEEAAKAEEAKLRQLDGATFDAAYLAAMVADHDLTVAQVKLAAQQFKGTEFGKELEQLAPVLQQHREHAYRVLGQLKQDQAGVGGSGQEGQQQAEPAQSEDQMGEDDPGLPTEGETLP